MPLRAVFNTTALLLLATTNNAHDRPPINPALGVPGFPDCINPNRIDAEQLLSQTTRRRLNALTSDEAVKRAAHDLICTQRGTPSDGSLKIATVGDSITAGSHSTGGNHTYPGQLQILLDEKYPGGYTVTNLGAGGSTMLKKGNSPYWKRPQYQTLIENTWDIVVIMLGTNDAKDPGDGGPDNWQHDCGGVTDDASTLEGCSYARDYLSMIETVQSLGPRGASPSIFVAVPPPLMTSGAIGANQTVINSVLPKLVPLINDAAGLEPHTSINVYEAMGGRDDWASAFPKECTLENVDYYPPCGWWCDEQSCDQCHPNDNGYAYLATAVMKGLGFLLSYPEVAQSC